MRGASQALPGDGARRRVCPTREATQALGERLGWLARQAGGAGGGPVVYLSGELGAGKTTFCQGALRGAGCEDPVTSPSYMLVCSHALRATDTLPAAAALHIDLYRIEDAARCEELALDDSIAESALSLLEWPERALAALPRPDLWIALAVQHDSEQRQLRWRGLSARGQALAAALAARDGLSATEAGR